MERIKGGAPLLSLDAVVVDTETTGLDPRKARMIELAGVRIVGGGLAGGDSFRQLLRPGNEPIPPTATQIHGIDDAAVAAAPAFAEVWPRFEEFASQSVLIGHTIGFDLAVMKRECGLAGMPWSRPRTLDTRLLAQIAAPELAGYTLEKLAGWLGIDVAGRHSALGDAIITARVFLALVPKLREHGIRTLAEAERACRALSSMLDDQVRIGWVEAVGPATRSDAEQTLQRFDAFAYRHRNRDIMRTPPVFVTPDLPLREALARMMRENISSLYVHAAPASAGAVLAAEAGIVTERDVLRAIDRLGAAALEKPTGEIMTRPLVGIPAGAFVYRAIGRMSRLKIRHLAVVDEAGRVVGALSARDLLRLRAGEATALGDEIDNASDARALSVAWAKLPVVAGALLTEGFSGREIAEVISAELRTLSHQAAVLAEQIMRERGFGEPPVPYELIVLGSAGRGESLLAMDQDNAVIFAQGEPEGSEDRWFATFGAHVADILHEAGVPYCKGGVMAKNVAWRGSVATWRKRIDQWIIRSNPADILSVDIFFDLEAVHGNAGLAGAVRQAAFDAARGQVAFAKLLVEDIRIPAGLGFFGGIRTEGGRIDIKAHGLYGLVATARAMAIRHHVMERSTPARLAAVKDVVKVRQTDFEALIEAHVVFLDLIATQQVEDAVNGIPPSNAVSVKRLTARGRERLRVALGAVACADELARAVLFQG